jgi:predicted ATPase
MVRNHTRPAGRQETFCEALDRQGGVPLAIELAAGRLRSVSFVDLAGRLADELAVLTRRSTVAGDEGAPADAAEDHRLEGEWPIGGVALQT